MTTDASEIQFSRQRTNLLFKSFNHLREGMDIVELHISKDSVNRKHISNRQTEFKYIKYIIDKTVKIRVFLCRIFLR